MRTITKKISVILVDDDPDDRKIFSEAIAKVAENFVLTTFRSGREIIDFLRNRKSFENACDVIFLDINMPVIDGLETLEIIRNELQLYRQPIAMYSTSSLDSDIMGALAAGANIYIQKPDVFGTLVETLNKALNAVIQHDSSYPIETFVLSL